MLPMFKRLSLMWTLLRGDLRKLWWALRDPRTPGWFKLAAALLAFYLVSPIDLLPDAIPFIGVLDDMVLLPLALHWLLSRLPASLQADLAGRASRA
jgi:uncharacterized membrane protein YkvA (DUF1232 family)